MKCSNKDLEIFLKKTLILHAGPLEDAYLLLCKNCSKEYVDKNSKDNGIKVPHETATKIKKRAHNQCECTKNCLWH